MLQLVPSKLFNDGIVLSSLLQEKKSHTHTHSYCGGSHDMPLTASFKDHIKAYMDIVFGMYTIWR